MKPLVQILILPLVLGLFAGCTKKREAPPAPAPAPAEAVTPPEAAPPAPAAQAPAAEVSDHPFDGEWNGDSGENLPFSFSIENSQVRSVYASYSGSRDGCSFNGSFGSSESVPLSEKSFTVKGSSEALHFVAKGTLTSPTEASGTLVWTGKTGICGEVDLQYSWTAKKAPPEPMEDMDD